jgi:hypothetical protein
MRTFIALSLLLATGCATIQPTLAAVPRHADVDTAPIPAEKKLHWGWTVLVIVVIVIVIAADQASDLDWESDDSGGFFGRRPELR